MSKINFNNNNECKFNLLKFFVKFKKDLFQRIKHKYSNPYMYHAVSQNELFGLKSHQIPTYYGMYQINYLVFNKPCRYNILFKDLNTENCEVDCLVKKYSRFESEILLKCSCQKEKSRQLAANVFPHEGPLLKIATTYYKTAFNQPTIKPKKHLSSKSVRKTDTNLIKIIPSHIEKDKEVSSKIQDNKENITEMGTEHYNSKIYLDSLFESNATSNDNSYELDNNPFLRKTNKNIRRTEGCDDSTSSMMELIDYIVQVEYDQIKVKPTRRQCVNLRTFQEVDFTNSTTPKNKVLLTTLKEEFKERHNVFFKSINESRGKFKHFYQTHKTEQIVFPRLKDFETKNAFKTTQKFVKINVKREKEEENRKNLLTSVLLKYNSQKLQKEREKEKKKFKNINFSQNGKTLRLKTEERINNNPNKIKNHKYCNTSTTFNSVYCKTHNEIINLYEFQNDLKTNEKTQKIINKVKTNQQKEKNQLRKSLNLIDLVNCPMIYSQRKEIIGGID